MTDPLEPFDPHGVLPAVSSADGDAAAIAEPSLDALAAGDVSLLALIDRLAALLERSDLTELEVASGETTLVLRSPAAFLAPDATATSGSAPSATGTGAAQGTGSGPRPDDATQAPERPSVKAPLTGIFYSSPAPGSADFVGVGSEIAVGTVIGLIEAMKLFNEIKSDLAGRVVRVVAENGALVKAKQPLIEVEPL